MENNKTAVIGWNFNILPLHGLHMGKTALWGIFGLVALVIRWPLLFHPLWYDEAFTLWLAKLPFPQMIAATIGDVHPPLYYVLAWLSVRVFPLSPWAIRFPALLFGLLSLPLFGAVLFYLDIPRQVKNLALGLVAFSPFLIYYSSEARMYSALLFFVLLSLYGVLSQNFLFFGLGVGLSMLTHNLGILYAPGAVFLYLLRWRFDLKLIFSGMTALVVYILWWPNALQQATAVKSNYWILPLTLGRVLNSVYQATAERSNTESTLIFAGLVVFALLALGIIKTIKYKKVVAVEMLLLSLGPVIMGFLVSLVYRPVLIPRVLIGASPFLLVLVAWGAVAVYQSVGRWSFALGIVPLLLVTNLYVNPLRPQTIPDLPVKQGDICYHLAPGSIVLGRAIIPDCDHYLFPYSHNLEQSLSNETKTAMGMHHSPIENLPAPPVWLFYSEGPYSAPDEKPALEAILATADYSLYFERETEGILTEQIWRLKSLSLQNRDFVNY